MTNRPLRIVLAAAALLFVQQSAQAEVVDSSGHGFTVRSTVTVSSSSKKAYQAFIKDVGRWWDSEHTYSGSASNLSIDARPGGLFSEKLPGGGFVEHMRVVYAEARKLLRMSGGLGPLQELGASGAMTISFVEKDSKTEVTMTYAVGGHMKQGLGSIAGIVDKVLSLQLGRFQAFVNKPN